MNKTIKFNNEALFNLQTLNGLIMSTWGMHDDEPEEKIEDAFKKGIIDFNHVKNRYKATFNMKNGPFEYDINYENTGRKKEAVKNIRKSKTVVSLPTCACSNAS